MSEIKPCAKCGKTPRLERYEQSNDGNHDKTSRVVCRCGNQYATGFREWCQAHDMLGDDAYERPTAFLSGRFMALMDELAIHGWNVLQAKGKGADLYAISAIAEMMAGFADAADKIGVTSLPNDTVRMFAKALDKAVDKAEPDGFCAWGFRRESE